VKQRADLTFKHNIAQRRHGWLRLTPAYSIKIVEQILDQHPEFSRVLEPFSGTATTGLVCGERGVSCTCFDINPFLIWFGNVKTATYSQENQICALNFLASLERIPAGDWLPPLFQIEKWWTPQRLELLAGLHTWLRSLPLGASRDLLSVAFCRCLIDWSNAAFNHQSMSFKRSDDASLFPMEDKMSLLDEFKRVSRWIIESAASPVTAAVQVKLADSRTLPDEAILFDALITSPPYPNRMSYIRELRPYMYWMGYLTDAKQAGELDWKAIGGTWGMATSLLSTWKEPIERSMFNPAFRDTISGIRKRSPLLANYVHKYFVDMNEHIQSAVRLLKLGAPAFYVVGNSKFYDTMVHVEDIYAGMLDSAGFKNVRIERIRKRNSKKELFEFLVSGTNDYATEPKEGGRAKKPDTSSSNGADRKQGTVSGYFAHKSSESATQGKLV
jgi:hypothetical protein